MEKYCHLFRSDAELIQVMDIHEKYILACLPPHKAARHKGFYYIFCKTCMWHSYEHGLPWHDVSCTMASTPYPEYLVKTMKLLNLGLPTR